jgi:WD40 repeat protein
MTGSDPTTAPRETDDPESSPPSSPTLVSFAPSATPDWATPTWATPTWGGAVTHPTPPPPQQRRPLPEQPSATPPVPPGAYPTPHSSPRAKARAFLVAGLLLLYLFVVGIGKIADSDFIPWGDDDDDDPDITYTVPDKRPEMVLGTEGKNYLRVPVIDPEEQTVATLSQNGTVTFWSVVSGDVEQVREVPGLRLESTDLAALSSDGHFLAVTNDTDRTSAVTVHDLTGAEEDLSLDQPGPLRDLAFTPYGGFLVAVTLDHRIQVWDPTTGDPLGPVVQAAEGPWAISDDATNLVYLDAEGQVHSCDPADPRSSDRSDIDFPDRPLTLTLNGDGTILVGMVQEEHGVGSTESSVIYRSLDRETDPPAEAHSMLGYPTSVIIDPEGELIASAEADGTIKVTRLSGPDAEPFYLWMPEYEVTLTSLRFAQDSSYLVGQLSDGRIALW